MTEATTLPTAQEAAESRLAERSPALPSSPDAPLIAVIQRLANDPNFDVEKLRELRAIQKEWDAEQNERAFSDALGRAQAVMPVIEKNKHVYFESRSAGKPPTDYWHADYGRLVEVVAPILAAEGLSYNHKVTQADGRVTVSCVLRGHGHSETITLSGQPDDTGGKNSIQQTKSTVTYLKRATLEMVTGAATKDEDDDGAGAGAPEPLISASQLAYLNAQIDEVGAEREGFLRYLGVEALEDLPASEYGRAEYAIQAKRKANEREQGDGAEADAKPEPHELLGAG